MQWWTLKQLKARNPRTRFSAVRALARSEAIQLVDPIVELLSDTDATVRSAAAETVARAELAAAVQHLCARFSKEPEPQNRVTLVKTLLAFPGPSIIPTLVEALGDPSGDVGWNAARALQTLQWQPANSTEHAAWHLAVSQWEDALSCGAAAVEPLAKLTRSVAFQRCIRAIECLSRIRDARAVKPLLECLVSQDFTIRAAAAGALGEIGDARAFDPLVHALRDAHHQVVLAACGSLGKMGDQRAVAPLIKVLQNSYPDVRTAAVSSLGKLRDSQAVPALLPLLQDRDPDVRETTVTALGFIGNELAIEPLVLMLIDPQSSIRQASAYSLRRIEPYWERSEAAARAIPTLQTALKSHEYWVRHSAADTLKKLGVSQESETTFITDSDGALRKRHAAQSILVAMLGDNDREFRQAAAEALGRIGLSEALPPLTQRLSDSDPGVQTAAARSLEALRWQPANAQEKARQLVALERWSEIVGIGAPALDALTEALHWQDDSTGRRRVLESIVQIGGPKAVAALRALSTNPWPALREEAQHALSILEPQPASATPPGKDAWAGVQAHS